MRTTQDYEVGAGYAMPPEPRGAGWVLFAVDILIIYALAAYGGAKLREG
jgi:hypothetical protein